MRKTVVWITAASLVFAACTGADEVGLEPAGVADDDSPDVVMSGTRVPAGVADDDSPDVVMSGTRVPGLFLEQFYGEWNLSAALTLNDDDSYVLRLNGNEDRGEYRLVDATSTLRLKSLAGDLCGAGDVARLAVEMIDGDSGSLLSVSAKREDCFWRGSLPRYFDISVSADSGFIGTFEAEASIDFRDDRSYSISTSTGTDIGTYSYQDGIQLLEFETTAGDLCEVGARATVEATGDGYIDVTDIIFSFGREDECPRRSQLQAGYRLRSES